jgi:AcrR family transcriptional regulator
LLEAGLAAFLQNGFSGTRLSDVAARAGLAKGTIYLHFPDKGALFAEVLRAFVRAATGGRKVGRPRPDEPTDHFLRRAVLPGLRDLQVNDRFRVLYLVLTEGAKVGELAAIYRAEAIDPVLKFVGIVLARAERRSELRSAALAGYPQFLAAPILLGTVWNGLFAQGDVLDVAAMFEIVIDIAFVQDARQEPIG